MYLYNQHVLLALPGTPMLKTSVMKSKISYTFKVFEIIVMIGLVYGSNETTSDVRRRIKLTKKDTCNDTIISLQKVDNCPGNDAHLRQRSIIKMCDSYPPCNGERLVYHCVRFQEYLVEVCSPMGYIRGKCCTMYGVGIGRVVEDYIRECTKCHFKYQSNDSIKYSECNVLDVRIFPQHTVQKSAATQHIELPETTSLPFLKQISNHEQTTSDSNFSLPESRTTGIFKRGKNQFSRPEDDKHYAVYTIIHAPVVLSIVSFLVIFAFDKK